MIIFRMDSELFDSVVFSSFGHKSTNLIVQGKGIPNAWVSGVIPLYRLLVEPLLG